MAIEPKTKADLEKMSTGLIKLAAEDPSFHFRRDEETNQTVIEGMGELHLEIIVDRLKREFGVEANVGAPQVNYRESINKMFELRYVHKKQSGGSGQFADVAIRFEPGEPGSGFEFVSEIKGGVVPKEYIPAVSKGLVRAVPRALPQLMRAARGTAAGAAAKRQGTAQRAVRDGCAAHMCVQGPAFRARDAIHPSIAAPPAAP